MVLHLSQVAQASGTPANLEWGTSLSFGIAAFEVKGGGKEWGATAGRNGGATGETRERDRGESKVCSEFEFEEKLHDKQSGK
jgi:hypothetical protein